MKKMSIDLNVSKDEFKLLKDRLIEIGAPLHIDQLASLVGLEKTKDQRNQKIKVYDSKYSYDINDLIFHDIDRKYKLSKNKYLEFKGGVVLRVVKKQFSPALGKVLLGLDYEGEGEFKKIINFLKKKKTLIELEAEKDEIGGKAPFYKGKDPREEEPPLAHKYLDKIRENLEKQLDKSGDFLTWGDYWIHKKQLVKIKNQEIIKIIRELEKSKESIETGEIKEKIIKIDNNKYPEELILFSVNYHLSNHQSFVCVDYNNWGKWNLKEFFDKMKKREPIFAKAYKLKKFEIKEKELVKNVKDFIKEYKKENKTNQNITTITLRELVSGALKIHKKQLNIIGNRREIKIIDGESAEEYKVFVFPYEKYLIGLKKYYKSKNIVPGTIINLEEKNGGIFITAAKSKRPNKIPLFDYNATDSVFIEKNSTTVYYEFFSYFKLDAGDLERLYELSEGKEPLSILRHIFISFSENQEGYKKLHYLKALHLMDILVRIEKEELLKLLLGNREFFRSEEEVGYFYLNEELMQEKEVVEQQKQLEKELKEKKKKFEKELIKHRKETVEEGQEQKPSHEVDVIEKQFEKIRNRLEKLMGKSNIVEDVATRPAPKKAVKPEEEKLKPDTGTKKEIIVKKEEKKVDETKSVSEKKTEKRGVKSKTTERVSKTEKEGKPTKTIKKKMVDKMPMDIKPSKKKKGKTVSDKHSVPKKKSARRILEEELEIKEAEKEALEALKEVVEIKDEKKKVDTKEETKVVYSDKKEKKTGILGEKLSELLKKKK
jgi:hypothetical protein